MNIDWLYLCLGHTSEYDQRRAFAPGEGQTCSITGCNVPASTAVRQWLAVAVEESR